MTHTIDTLELSTTAEDVIDYLRDHPDFLQRNPEAIDLLAPPRAEGGKGVADFQNYMIARLKADKEDALTSTRTIVETTRANMNNQRRIHDSVLRILECERFDDFIQTVTLDLAAMLGVDIGVLLVEADGCGRAIPHVGVQGIRVIPQGTADMWMGHKTVLLQDRISGIEAVYGGGAALVRSQILLRIDISKNTPPAILAFGSRDPDLFAEGQATDQIQFLARVIERSFRAWLAQG